MKQVLNDLADLQEVLPSKKYVKVNIESYLKSQGFKRTYNVSSLTKENGITTLNVVSELADISDDKFGYTHVMNRYDIEKIKSLKYLGYLLNFDNQNKKVYVWLENGKNIILKKGFKHIKGIGNVSNIIAKCNEVETNITDIIEKAIQAEKYGLMNYDMMSNLKPVM